MHVKIAPALHLQNGPAVGWWCALNTPESLAVMRGTLDPWRPQALGRARLTPLAFDSLGLWQTGYTKPRRV